VLRNFVTRLITPEAAFFAVVWVVFLSQFRERAFADAGTLWHTIVGDKILADGFMTTDPFTYTHPGRTWIPQQWGGEVLMALAHRIAGLDTLLLAFATGVAALFTWVFYRLRRVGMHWLFAGALTLGACFVASFHFYIRPHLATIAFLTVTTAVLIEFDRGRLSLGRLALLIPLFVVWTNVHGGVLGGLLSFGVAAAGWALSYLSSRPGPITSVRGGFTVLGILIACALTPFDNPFGMEMIHTWQRIVGSTVMKEVVNEHKPLDPTAAVDQLLIAFGLAYCVLFAGVLPTARREFRATWLIPLVWMVLTIKGIRQGPLFVATAMVVLADFWPYTRWQELLRKYGDSLAYGDAKPAGVGTFALPVVLVGVAFALQVAGVSVPLVGRGWARPPVQYVPTDLTPAIVAELETHPDARLFNDCNLGGYLIYYHPGREIFMDDRFELYGDAWLREYVEAVWNHPERVEDYCDRYQCTHALVGVETPQTPYDTYLSASPRWAEVARGKGAVLFRRVP
jgi:hypothetical protein